MENNSQLHGTVFDDVFRTMVQKMPTLMIPLINEFFGTNYSDDEKITQLRNEHEEIFGKIITDSIFVIRGKTYHIECQSTDDTTMAIRMIEYDFSIALEHAQKNNRYYELDFPETGVLYLRSTLATPDALKVKVNFPNGESVIYNAKTMMLSNYNKDMIFKKRLFCLLPYYILKYEAQKKEIAKDNMLLSELLKEYEDIRKKLETVFLDTEKSGIYMDLINLIIRISDYIFAEEEEVKKGVDSTMGGKILELESERLIRQGIEQVVINALKRDMAIADIAAITNLTEEEVKAIQDRVCSMA